MGSMALPVRLDHCVIHVSYWEVSNAFYRDVVGAELVQSDGRTAYRFGAQQLNLHGPGLSPEPVARLPVQPGNSDLCFAWDGPIEDAVAHLEACGVTIELGPVERNGAGGRAAASTSATPTGACSSSSPTASGAQRALERRLLRAEARACSRTGGSERSTNVASRIAAPTSPAATRNASW